MSEATSGAQAAPKRASTDALDDATAVRARSSADAGRQPAPLVQAGNGAGASKATPVTTTSSTGTSSTGTSSAGTGVASGTGRGRPQRTRRARLRISRIDPWSAMKTSFLFAIAGGIIFWVATYLVWAAIGSSGLFDSLNSMVGDIVNAQGQEKFQIQKYVSTNKVLGFAAVLAFVDVVLLTILGTLGSFLYNLSATMLGGLELTLAED